MKRLIKSFFICFALLISAWLARHFYEVAQSTNPALKKAIQLDRLPKHVAVMMDGNGRWAKKQGQPRVFGHQHALQSLRDAIEGCVELHIPYLTLYAFSTENWDRPAEEINVLMELFTKTLQTELQKFAEHDIKLTAIGEIERLPQHCQEALCQAIETTKAHQGLQLTIALSYSGRWDIIQATKAIAQEVVNNHIKPADINAAIFQNYLSTKGIPDPDLLIRTGGDMRISNFLLWQMAYTELVIIPTYWPEFTKKHLYEAIITYQQRERRFGKIWA
jgi:undecaprenyl diphosphate synthase